MAPSTAPATPPTRRPRGRAAVRFAAVWIAAVAIAACQSNPSGTYRGTYQRAESDGTTSTNASHLAEVGVQDRLGPSLEYRFSDRYLDSRSEVESGDERVTEDRTLHQPSLDLSLAVGALTWISGFETQQQTVNPSSRASNRLTRDDLLQKLIWEPENLPRVEAWVERTTNQDDAFVHRENTEGTLLIERSAGALTYQYSLQGERDEDLETGVRRDRIEHILRGTYEDQLADGEVDLRLGVFLDHRDSTARVPSGATIGLPPDETILSEGLSAIDLTPEVGTLATNPGLVDGDDSSPVGVNIGGFASGGEVGWNIGFRAPTETAVDLVLLSTEEEVNPFLWSDFTFSFWVSDDGQFWNLVTGNAAFTYETAFRRFRLLVPAVSGRYFKLVANAVPPNADAIQVTEVRAFAPSTVVDADPLKRKSTDRTRNLSTSVQWAATDELRLGYDLFAQVIDRASDDRSTSDETRIDNGVNASWTPTAKFEAGLRAQSQITSDPLQTDQAFTLLSALLDYRALETLDLALSYTFTNRAEDHEDSFRASVAQFRTSAQLLPTLQADVTLEKARQDDILNERVIDRTIVGAQAVADLTRTVDLTLSARKELADVTGAGAAGIPDPDEDIYEILVAYRPTDRLTAEVQLEWRDSFAGEGLDRRLRLDWIPFRDGALDLQLDAQQLDNGVLEMKRDQYLLLSRWNFNPSAFLEVNWALQKPEGEPSSESLTMGLNLSF